MNYSKHKIAHIITGLDTGGAEMMLYKLLKETDLRLFDIHVISLTSIGEIGTEIKNLGIKVSALNMTRGIPNPFSIFRLVKMLKELNIEIVQTWMYHADLIGLISSKLAGIPHVVWGVHHSNLNPETNKKLTLQVVKFCSKLSKRTTKIVCCSNTSAKVHKSIGYDSSKIVVIPNGFDTKMFNSFLPSNMDFKRMHNIPLGNYIVGHVARWDSLKDHQNFINAAAKVSSEFPKVTFVMCGEGIDESNNKLNNWIEENNLKDKILLLGKRNDINTIMPSFDIFVSSSVGEAFPNVIGEAMSCEIPCVVTDVGDCSYMVGDTGKAVPPRNSMLLAKGVMEILNLSVSERERLGDKARKRVEDNFHINVIVKKYSDMYIDILSTEKV